MKLFEIAVCFAHFDYFEISTPVNAHHANHGKHSLSDHFRYGAHPVYKIYSDFKLFEIAVCFAHFDFFEVSTPVNAHHANRGKHSLNDQLRHGAHSVYKIYSDLKLFEIAVCFAHFDFFEISTPVMRVMVTMVNIV